jgi:hypothetical protein
MKARYCWVVLGTILVLQTGSASALTVRSADIVNGEVKSVDIGANAVTADKIMDGAVGTSDLANLAVTNEKIAAGAVNDSKITGPISANKISTSGLNADMVDGQHAASFASAAHMHGDLDSRIVALESAITSLQSTNISQQAIIADLSARLAAVETSPVSQLNGYLRVEPGEINGLHGPHAIFEGVNVHVRSGSGQTSDGGELVGLGNLVVGYNEAPEGLVQGDRGAPTTSWWESDIAIRVSTALSPVGIIQSALRMQLSVVDNRIRRMPGLRVSTVVRGISRAISRQALLVVTPTELQEHIQAFLEAPAIKRAATLRPFREVS